MSTYATYATILAAVEKDLEMEDEGFVSPAEFLNFCNDGIHEAETLIHTLCEDYFLNSVTVNLVQGQRSYLLPLDIFADKIRKVVYANGEQVYEIRRFRDKNAFVRLSLIPSDADYKYIVVNPDPTTRVFSLYPVARATETATITIWYLRRISRVAVGTDLIEIPEFRVLIECYMKKRALFKEKHPAYPEADAEYEKEKLRMMATLEDRYADEDNEIIHDETHYWEHS